MRATARQYGDRKLPHRGGLTPAVECNAKSHYIGEMTTLTVTSRGQVTFRKEVLQHLGIQPGQKIRLDLLPDGRAELRAEQMKGAWADLSGFLKDRTNGARLSIEQIDALTAQAGADSEQP